MKTDPRIDAYISKAADFAKPVLQHLRELVHQACPDVEETIKWGFPHFMYQGSILCSMASFKQHCAFTFRKGPLMKDPYQIFILTGETAMGQFGRIKSLENLPSDTYLLEYLCEAMALSDSKSS